MLKIKITEDFSDITGGRTREQGNFSGEAFFEDLLEPKFVEAKNLNEKLLIDFDDSYGYNPSFLEQAFGELARKYGVDLVLQVLELKSDDELSLIDDVIKYIKDVNINGKIEK